MTNLSTIDAFLSGAATAVELPTEVIVGGEDLRADFESLEFTNFAGSATPGSGFATTGGLFDFAISVINASVEDFAADFIDDVFAATAAAIEGLSQFIVGADGASLEIAVTIADLAPGAVASATAGDFFFFTDTDTGELIESNGFVEILTSTQVELQTGVDLNGDAPDVIITVASGFLEMLSFDTAPDRVGIPGVIDAVSVLTHELIHSLGVLSFRSAGPDFVGPAFDLDGDGIADAIETTFGSFVEFEDNGDPFLTGTFNGENLVEVFGEAVILETTTGSPGSDVAHFAATLPDGTVSDTALAIENPFVIPGDIVTVGAIELAVLEDLGFEIDEEASDGLGLLNELDFLPFTPTVTVAPETSIVDGELVVTVELDVESLFISLPSSVGIEIIGPDGTTQTQRVRIPADETSATVALDVGAFFGSGVPEELDVRLFFPAQVQLANGGTEETTTISVPDADFIIGTDGDDDISGSFLAETIFGLDGDDDLSGGSGNDEVFGGDGDDEVTGGNGNDDVSGGAGNDTVRGGNGFDTVDGGDGDDEVTGGNGNDDISGGAGNDTIDSGNGFDTIDAGSGDDDIEAGNGSDFISAGTGNDTVIAGNGFDTVDAGSGDDSVEGGNGNDVISGGEGADTLTGGNGSDTLGGGAGDDVISGGNGGDDIIAGSGSDQITTGSGSDEIFFTFGEEGDSNVVTDFNDRQDDLIFDGFDFESIADILAAATQVDDDVEIILDSETNQTLLLLDTDLDDLSSINLRIGEALEVAELVLSDEDTATISTASSTFLDESDIIAFTDDFFLS